MARRTQQFALVAESASLTYLELNRAANQVAHRLVLRTEAGLQTGPVVLLMDQGIASVVSILAVLKTGRIYSPLDRRLPIPVLSAMVEHLSPAVAVIDARNRALAQAVLGDRCPILEAEWNGDGDTSANLHLDVSPDAMAYVYFTSGSSGLPKAVVDTHRNVLHNILRYTNSLGFAPGDRMSLVQNPSFSGTVSTLFGALLNGATVHPLDMSDIAFEDLGPWLRRQRVTVFHSVPSIFRRLPPSPDRYPDLRLIRLEGDQARASDQAHFKRVFSDRSVLVNGLGATECGLVRQFFVDQASPEPSDIVLPVGQAIDGVTIDIVDESGKSLPPESTGEIVVESAYLALGYWNNPQLTEEKFGSGRYGLRRYHTGDLGRLDDQGCLMHLGRQDMQTRIGGRFVDTVYLEGVLSTCAGIREALLQTYNDRDGGKHLAAYLVASAHPAPTVTELRERLTPHIAAHMMPSAFVYLDALPLSADGKVDRRRLPVPTRSRPALSVDYLAPKTALEKRIAQIWAEVLDLDEVGVNDSFLELGGESLRANQILGQLRDAIDPGLNIVSIFEHPTVRTLAMHLSDVADKPSEPAVRPAGFRRQSTQRRVPTHSVAIVGMAGRFPGAVDIDMFWENLRAGRESITFFGDLETVDASGDERKVSARGLLEDVDTFDAAFFGLTPRQARCLDPQQRIWLECVFHALESTNQAPDSLRRDVGVFAGARDSGYLWQILGGNPQAVEDLLLQSSDEMSQLQLGNERDFIATRTSYLFGFTGPSINVQTACSTSLVAVAQACQALANRQCGIAIAGGVSVAFPQQRAYRSYPGGIYSRDGHCRAFDAAATGTVFSDGVGAVVLKRLEDAQADGDYIEAVIRGWAVNNDGSDKASFSAPNVEGQARVIAQAQSHAQVHPRDIGYIEAHGTGTRVGDPIEVAGLTRAFANKTAELGYCGIGSVKTNVGHLDAAAGIVGLIKTVVSLREGEVPPTLHFQSPNPDLEIEKTPFFVVDRLQDWPLPVEPRIAGVSSFGVGGTNCHLILQQAETSGVVGQETSGPAVLTLSAKTQSALKGMMACYRDYLSEDRSDSLSDIAATAQISRSEFGWRAAVAGQTKREIASALTRDLREVGRSGVWRGRTEASDPPVLGFVFTGQGSQYAGMASELFGSEPGFRDTLQRCERIVSDQLDRPLLSVMFARNGDGSLIHRSDYSHAALFAVQYALTVLLRSWGIEPAVVMGHSLGEYAAACASGVFGLEAGLRLVTARGSLLRTLEHDGQMLTVWADREQVGALIRPYAASVSVAAVNGPRNTVISGAATVIQDIVHQCGERGWHTQALNVSHAFHSPLIAPVLEPLERLARAVTLQAPSIHYVSAMHGQAVIDAVTAASYWRDHARQPVEFAAGVRAMQGLGCNLWVEIGPNAPLAGLIGDCISDATVLGIPTLRRDTHDRVALLETLGRLYVCGVPIDWSAVQQFRRPGHVRLPPYPFQRQRYWYEVGSKSLPGGCPVQAAGTTSHDPLIGERIRLPGSDEIRFAVRHSPAQPTYLDDHRLFGVPVAPGASHFSMLAQAATTLGDGQPVIFHGLYLVEPLVFPNSAPRDLQLIFTPADDGWALQLVSTAAGTDEWAVHMIGRARLDPAGVVAGKTGETVVDIGQLTNRAQSMIPGTEFYSKIWANQGGTGAAFRWIDTIWRSDGEAVCRTACPVEARDHSGFRLHPGLIEAACQLLHCCETIETAAGMAETGATFVPFSVERYRVSSRTRDADPAWCHAVLRHIDRSDVVGDLTILAGDGSTLARIEGFCLRPIARSSLEAANRGFAPDGGVQKYEHVPPAASAQTEDTSSTGPEALLGYLMRECARLSGHDVSQITPDTGFVALGLDSIAAIMLVNGVKQDLGIDAHVVQVLRSSSMSSLARIIAAECGHSKPGA